MINVLQIICNLPLFNLKFPANANFATGLIMNIVSFDIIPTEQAYDSIFNFTDINPDEVEEEEEVRRYLMSTQQHILDPSSNLAIALDSLNYSGNFLQNIGSNFVFFVGFMSMLIFMVPLKCISRRNNRLVEILLTTC
jgi:hypothetical protein